MQYAQPLTIDARTLTNSRMTGSSLISCSSATIARDIFGAPRRTLRRSLRRPVAAFALISASPSGLPTIEVCRADQSEQWGRHTILELCPGEHAGAEMGSAPDGVHPYIDAKLCRMPLTDQQGDAPMPDGVHRLGSQTGDREDARSQEIKPRGVRLADWRRFEHTMAEIFTVLGMNPETPGTERTPARFLKALYDATSGYEGDQKLLTAFPTECRCDTDCLVSQIIEGPISFYSLCEHHALPFHGFVHVGYVAHERIIGISKLTRLVRLFARRFTVQERLGEQIADGLVELMEPHGVAVHIDAVHLCTQMRGVREEHSHTATSLWRGVYSENPELRREFLAEVGSGNHWT
jgi:GTP cyclohydrolase IA